MLTRNKLNFTSVETTYHELVALENFKPKNLLEVANQIKETMEKLLKKQTIEFNMSVIHSWFRHEGEENNLIEKIEKIKNRDYIDWDVRYTLDKLHRNLKKQYN